MIPNEKNYARDMSIKEKKEKKLPFFIRETENQLSIKGKTQNGSRYQNQTLHCECKNMKTDLKKHWHKEANFCLIMDDQFRAVIIISIPQLLNQMDGAGPPPADSKKIEDLQKVEVTEESAGKRT